jgi:hypothetical protein
MKTRLFDFLLVAILVAVWVLVASLAAAGLDPVIGSAEADTVAGAGLAAGSQVKEYLKLVRWVMAWVVDNQGLVAAFGLALVGFYGTISQARGKRAAVSALDLVTTSVEIAEEPVDRNHRSVKRQVESATPVLGRLALRMLENSVRKASK